MLDVAKKLLEQGIPTMLFLLASACLALGFFEVTAFSPFSYVRRIDTLLIAVAFILLLLSIGLWSLDRKKPLDADAALDGHFVLIKLLRSFSQAHDFRPPEYFASVVAEAEAEATGALASRAARYGAMYLHSIGLLESNQSGSEFRSSAKADAVLKKNDFRARNAGAFVDGA